MRQAVRGEKHHWWPKSLSRYWFNDEGFLHCIDTNEQDIISKPENFGQISNGHNIIFDDSMNGVFTVEQIFDTADGYMPKMVEWFELLISKPTNDNSNMPLVIDSMGFEEHLNVVRECIISLIVRSPKYRYSKQQFTAQFRGSVEKRESMGLVAANIHQSYSALTSSFRDCGKLVIISSENSEFIYGDGFYSNIGATT
jgi:hypothetical protein